MALKLTINIARKYNNELIPQLDRTNYFKLGKAECMRGELFNFALALGYNRNYQTQAEGKESFFRTENIGNDRYIYASVYFQKNLENKTDNIDEIVDDDLIFKNAEDYANTGFSIIKDFVGKYSEEDLLFELIGDMDQMYEQYEKDKNSASKDVMS